MKTLQSIALVLFVVFVLVVIISNSDDQFGHRIEPAMYSAVQVAVTTADIVIAQIARMDMNRGIAIGHRHAAAAHTCMAAWVSGYQVCDWTDKREPHENPRKGLRLEAGTIQIQGHDPTTDLSFRNLRIAELPDR